MPFKLEIMPLLDEIHPLAERIGAVNTVVNREGQLVGHNTDWSGAARALDEQMKVSDARVLVLGAGGAARAVAFGLIERGASVAISNRTDERGRALASELDVSAVPWAERGDPSFDALVNATSAGMRDVDPASPFPEERIAPDTVVMDIVYKPLDTLLIRAAKRRGAQTLHGGRMLLHQAARQHELYTGLDAPLDAMNAALMTAIAGLS
jgi:shikimate dehydrogenase